MVSEIGEWHQQGRDVDLSVGSWRVRLTFPGDTESFLFHDCIVTAGGINQFHKWPVFSQLLWFGAEWPQFMLWLSHYQSRYQRELKESPRFRDLHWRTLKEERRERIWREDICRNMPGHFPRDVFPLSLAEATLVRPARIWEAIRGITEPSFVFYSRYAYVREYQEGRLLSYLSSQEQSHLFVNPRDPGPSWTPKYIWNELCTTELLLPASKCDAATLIGELRSMDVREILTILGTKNRARVRENLDALVDLANRDPERVRAVICMYLEPGNPHYLMPPPGLTWQGFLDGRQIAMGMATTLQDIEWGNEGPSYAEMKSFGAMVT